MLDFYKNTYYIRLADKDEAIRILKKYPEYKGFTNDRFSDDKMSKGEYQPLWLELENRFGGLLASNKRLFLDNEYLHDEFIKQHPESVKIAEVYSNGAFRQHNPVNLLPELKQLEKQVMMFE